MTRLLRIRPLAAALLMAAGTGSAAAADLVEAYQLARDSDPQLAAVEAQRLAQAEGVVQSRANLLPQVGASASLSKSSNENSGVQVFGGTTLPPSSSESDSTSRRYGIDVQQTLYNRAHYTGLRASRARAERAVAEYDVAAQGLMVRVADAYFGALTAIESLVVARGEERAVKRQLDQAEQRFEVGLTAITDVHEARARYDAARANAIAAETRLFDAREALAEVAGRQLDGLMGLSDGFQPELPEPANPEAWVELALAGNPSLRARGLGLTAAEHDIGSARAAHLPTLGLTAGYSDQSSWGDNTNRITQGNTLFSNDGRGGSVGVSLNVPIFSGFATQSRVRQAIYGRDAAAEQLEAERRAVTRQTRNAYRALLAGITEIEARKQAMVSAQSALEATEAGFEVGTRTIVDVLIAQQQLFQTQRDYASARHGFLVNNLRLKQAAGTIVFADVESVNRLLVRDAEAALDAPPAEPAN